MGEEIRQLHAEVRLNRIESITRRKDADADGLMNAICAQNELGETVFHVGARYGRMDVVQLALGLFNDSPEEKGYVLKLRNRRGLLAMHEALFSGETSTAKLLLSEHPMRKTKDPQSSQGSSYEITEEQTSDDLEDFKDTFLHALTTDDNVIIKELLVLRGAGFVSEICSESPLEICASKGSWKTFSLFLDNKEVIKPNANGMNLLQTAIVNGRWPDKWREEVGKALLDEPDLEGNTPLHFAISYKNVAATQWLIGHGANMHAMNSQGQKALDVAKECNFSNEVQKILKGKKASREWAVQVDREETEVTRAADGKTQLSQTYANLLPWLIAACFTSVLTVPGAFNALGLPNMLHEPSFKAFLMCIATAMSAGLISAICMVSGKDFRVCGKRYRVERLGFVMVRIAFLAFLGAFCLVVSMMSCRDGFLSSLL